MIKFVVEIGRKVLIDAKNADAALDKFWRDWEQSCAEQNTEMITELADTSSVRRATKEEVEELG